MASNCRAPVMISKLTMGNSFDRNKSAYVRMNPFIDAPNRVMGFTASVRAFAANDCRNRFDHQRQVVP